MNISALMFSIAATSFVFWMVLATADLWRV